MSKEFWNLRWTVLIEDLDVERAADLVELFADLQQFYACLEPPVDATYTKAGQAQDGTGSIIQDIATIFSGDMRATHQNHSAKCILERPIAIALCIRYVNALFNNESGQAVCYEYDRPKRRSLPTDSVSANITEVICRSNPLYVKVKPREKLGTLEVTSRMKPGRLKVSNGEWTHLASSMAIEDLDEHVSMLNKGTPCEGLVHRS